MQFLFVLVAIGAGMTSALQSGSNQMLQKSLVSPLWTVVIVSAVTLLASLPIALVAGGRLPEGAAIGSAPWWSWIGGIFGLAFVLATVYAAPKLGAGAFVALIVTASTVTSIVLDHFGWMGFEVHRAGIARVAGALFMAAGVGLIAGF